MGGLALKHLDVKRIDATRYRDLSWEVVDIFTSTFNVRADVIPAYRNKPDFGDCDMLICNDDLKHFNWREQLSDIFKSRGYVRNGEVTSMEIDDVQFDFISVSPEHREVAYTYFAYNDLGNLMGRVAHKMGFRYGHKGLQLPLRNDKDHTFRVVDVPASVPEIFDFLGYSYERWQNGFDDLEDIFKYVALSPFFNKDIYLLDNLNAVSRIRDKKRKTYMEFLQWCATADLGRGYMWRTDLDWKLAEKASHFNRACSHWPELRATVSEAFEKESLRVKFASRWNGGLAMKLFPSMRGKDLGMFLTSLREQPEFEEFVMMDSTSPERLEAYVKLFHVGYQRNRGDVTSPN